jgi:xylulokinase
MIGVVDCGLSSVKVSLIAGDGSVVERTTEPYLTHFDGLRAEQDPEEWWRALSAATARLENASKIEVIVPTGHMHALVVLDADERALIPCLTLHDRRAIEDVAGLDASWFYDLTGQLLSPSLPFAKLLWLQRLSNDVLRQARTLLAPKDFIRLRLCGGRPLTDPVDAAGTGIYDVARGCWSRELAERCGVTNALPEIAGSGTVSGAVSRHASLSLGVLEGTPVITGAGDDIELLGATAHREGAAVEHLGTTGAILACGAGELRLDPRREVEVYPVVSNGFAVGTSTPNTGVVLAWVERVFGRTPDQITNEWSGNNGLIGLPFLHGERTGSAIRGGAIVGLTAQHDGNDVAHAMLLGAAFELKELLDKVAAFSPLARDITTSGGQNVSCGWAKLRATVYGQPIRIPGDDPTATGCAALALAAMNGGEVEQRAQALISNGTYRQIDPDPLLEEQFRAMFDEYKDAKSADQARSPARHFPQPGGLWPASGDGVRE